MDVDDWSGLAHAACASNDNDNGDDSIGVASPMKMICFSSDPIGVSFCSFSVEGKVGSDVRREREKIKTRSERRDRKSVV